MAYNIINNLPIDYKFSTKSKKELKLYEAWFRENKDKRITELFNAVVSTQGFENWVANFTRDSLKELGAWLKQNTVTEKISEAEYNEKRAKIPDYIELNDWDLTTHTRSILVDIGIYLGEVFIHTYPGLKWEQYLSTRNNENDRGHMVIKMATDFYNPIWTTYIIGLGLVKKKKDESCLINNFKTWSKYVK